MQRTIKVVEYDAQWPELFAIAAKKIRQVFADELIDLYHIGSTAIPHMKAKPVIDLLLVVPDINTVDQYDPPMERLGYTAKGEFGIPGRRLFLREENGERTQHLHIFQEGDPHVADHLRFRDYLVAHPEKAKAYAELKSELATQHPHDIDAYLRGKNDFIRSIIS